MSTVSFSSFKRSIVAHTGHVTRVCNIIKKQCNLAESHPSVPLYEELKESLKKLKDRYDNMEYFITHSVIEDPGVENTAMETYCQSKIDDLTETFEHFSGSVYETLSLLEDALQMHGKPAHNTTISGWNDEEKVKADPTLRPKKISSDFSHVELKRWLNDFKSFYTASHFEKSTIAVQQAYFLSFLDTDIRQRVEPLIQPHTQVLDADEGCYQLLIDFFDLKNPKFNRRLDYFAVKQNPGETSSQFVSRLEAIGNEADLASLDVDDTYVYRILEGLVDKKLRDRLLKLQTKTRQAFILEMRNYDAAEATSKKLDNPTNCSTNRAYSVRGRIEPVTSHQNLKGKCWRCSGDHPKQDCKYKSSVKCSNCKRLGHTRNACTGINAGRQSRPTYKSKAKNRLRSNSRHVSLNRLKMAEEHRDKLRTVGGRRVPHISVEIRTKNNSGAPFKYDIVPDSGSSRTVVPLKIAKMYGWKFSSTNERILAANNSPLCCDGRIFLKISHGNRTADVDALISRSLEDEILISWYDLISLGILPKNFPEQICSVHEDSLNEQKFQSLIDRYSDVLSDNLKDTPIVGSKFKLELKDNAVARKFLTARKLPLHYEAEAKKIIGQMLKDGIIKKQEKPSEWISPAFFVPKSNGKLRLVVDYKSSGLNNALKRRVHPFPSADDIMKQIKPTSKWFLKADCIQGYHQVPLDEKSQQLTTFILPDGVYYFTRAPMGLNGSGDIFCFKTDEAFTGMDISKIVDDILIQGKTQEEVFTKFEQLLKRCRKFGITLSKSKLFMAKENLKFSGFIVGQSGIHPDPSKLESLKLFPSPTNLTSLRSFLGLTNQLGGFIPDLSQMTLELRSLLKKNVAFNWMPEHEEKFRQIKYILTSDMVIKPFDTKKKTILLTDASKINGIGFALMQENDNGERHMVQCGSRSLTPAETNYAVIELECLGIYYAISKCRHYLTGLHHFTTVTDHRPLVGIFKKKLEDIENSRLLRLRLKLVDFNFDVVWIDGKVNQIADALSRYPVFRKTSSDEDHDVLTNPNIICSLQTNPHLAHIYDAADNDEDYKAIIDALQAGKLVKNLPQNHPGKLYRNVWVQLSINDGLIIKDDKQIVIPKKERSKILEMLHIPHCGEGKTKANARQLYYWPGMSNDIENICRNCIPCNELKDSLQKEPLIPTIPAYPMSHCGVDLAQCHGKHYLILVDAFSGFPFCAKLNDLHTSAVTNRLHEWFMDFGTPSFLRSDGGPQFRSEFNKFCKEFGIEHSPSSPYFSSSNGLAENGVKQCKHLLMKCDGNFKLFRKSLHEYRNTPRTDGYSAAQLMFGRRQKGMLPCLPKTLSLIDIRPGVEKRRHDREKRKESFDKHTKPLSQLKIGQEVYIQNPFNGKWDSSGSIVSMRENGRSYEIRMDNGKVFLRNRRFLRIKNCTIDHKNNSSNTKELERESDEKAFQRFERLKRKVKFKN